MINKIILKCKTSVYFLYRLLFSSYSLYRIEEVNAFATSDVIVICAHPDDESLFFHKVFLENNNVAVICLSNRSNTIRRDEFNHAICKLNAQGVIFDFPDNVYLTWVWKLYLPRMMRLLKKYIHPQIIYTHNRKGEYGHIHHIITHQYVVNAFGVSNVSTSDDVNETKEETQLRRSFLEEVYRSQNLKEWFPENY